LYGTHRHNTPALGSSFTALFTVTTVVFFFPLRDVIHRHITAAGLPYRYPRKPKLYEFRIDCVNDRSDGNYCL
jgi:hypothetical protein